MKQRGEVIKFSEAMEEVLKENDFKGGWKEADREYLFFRLKEEVRELEDILFSGIYISGFRIQKEAVDIANFAMMIADNFGGLTYEHEDFTNPT